MWRSPMNGRPEGPGMAVAAADLDLERAQARPPGWRKKAKMEIRRRVRKKTSKLWEMEMGTWRKRVLKFSDDIFFLSFLFFGVCLFGAKGVGRK